MGFASADATSAKVTGGAVLEAACRWDLVCTNACSDNAALSSVCRWDLAPGKQREQAGVSRMPVEFGLAQAARMEVTAACAGGICFCGYNQTGGAGGRVPVGFGSTEAQRKRGAAVRVPAGFGSRKAARTSWGHPCAIGIWLGGGGKDGGDGGVCRGLPAAR